MTQSRTRQRRLRNADPDFLDARSLDGEQFAAGSVDMPLRRLDDARRVARAHAFDGPVHGFGGGGALELDDATRWAEGGDGGAQGFAHAEGEHERRLADGLAAVDDAGFFGFREELDREARRTLAEAG